MLVGQGTKSHENSNDDVVWNNSREWDRRKLATFQPMHSRGVNGDGFFSGNVRTIFQITVLSFLLGFEVQP